MIIFPSSPTAPKQPDPSFQSEYEAAVSCGFRIGFVDIELILGGEVILRFPNGSDEQAVYRGWIIKPDAQERLWEALQPNCHLVNSAQDYRFLCSYTNWIKLVDRSICPTTVGMIDPQEIDFDAIHVLLSGFAGKPIIVKDFIKSRKQDWFDACFISSASDKAEVERVIKNFLQLQGSDFYGGLLFREYVPLKRIGTHSKSRMPLSNEHRYFMFGQQFLAHYPYWSEGDYNKASIPPTSLIRQIASKFNPGMFYTIDLAEKADGGWLLIEIGEGGSCGIPENGNPSILYNALSNFVI